MTCVINGDINKQCCYMLIFLLRTDRCSTACRL